MVITSDLINAGFNVQSAVVQGGGVSIEWVGDVNAEVIAQAEAFIAASGWLELDPNAMVASDVLVGSPKPKDDPIEALEQAIGEAGKDGYKSIALIALAVVKYIKNVEERLKKKGI